MPPAFRSVLLVVAGVLLGALATRLLWGTRTASDDRTDEAREQGQPSGAGDDEIVDLRPRVAAEVEATMRDLGMEIDRAEVEALLDRLEARARAQGQVTALEVQPGLSAIDALVGSIRPDEAAALQAEFSSRMQRLSEELRGVTTETAAAP